jgi:uncharacterized protein YjiS (DUF1127 family)
MAVQVSSGLPRSGDFQSGDRLGGRRRAVDRAIKRTRRCMGVVAAAILEWRRRRRSRLELMARSDRELWDLGITRDSAAMEAAKPFWRE